MAAWHPRIAPLAAGLAVLVLLVVVIVVVATHRRPGPLHGDGSGGDAPRASPAAPPPGWAPPRGGKNPGGNQRECILDVTMMPSATSCPCAPPLPSPSAVRVLNMNVQQEGNASGKKFGCIGDVFVADCVDLLAVAEIDNPTTLGNILAYADGGASRWAGAACSAAKGACTGGTAGAGVGIAWRADRFRAQASARPPDGPYGPAVALPNGAWGVQVSAESEQGQAWMQYRKLIYVVLKRVSGEGGLIVFGCVHLGRGDGDATPPPVQGGNAGAAVAAAMKQSGAKMAVIGGDWNPQAAGAIAKFGVAAAAAGKTTGCATSANCDVDLQVVAVNGRFSSSCADRASWVADDHGGLAGTQVVVTPTA